MVALALETVSKHYGGQAAVCDLSLAVGDGELVALVGPSGCGKTTLLRLVAGLESPDAGTVRIGGRVVNDVPAGQRDVAMVFQHHALYPHLTVAENMGFGLALRRVARDEIGRRVGAEARVLGLVRLLRRRPAGLSAGHQQSVAVGRATARVPAAYLMDEPLSHLDPAARGRLRAELRGLQQGLGVATLYVTTDQAEALALGDRVAVMSGGRLIQVDSPQAVYERPADLFVAGFVGAPPMNLLTGLLDLGERRAWLVLGGQTLGLGPVPPLLRAHAGRRVVVGVRPEHLGDAALAPGVPADRRLRATVERVEALGSHNLVHATLDDAAGHCRVVARLPWERSVRRGADAELVVDPAAVHVFDPETGAALWHAR